MEDLHVPKRVAENPNPKKKIALIAAGSAAVVLLGGYLGLCAWVGGSPDILKGVSVAGVPVGGMSRQEALAALDENLGQVSGQVTLPLEYGHWAGEITAAAVHADEQATAEKAWQTGREHFLLQGGAYLGRRTTWTWLWPGPTRAVRSWRRRWTRRTCWWGAPSPTPLMRWRATS